MKVALFSDIITWIGVGKLDSEGEPDTIADEKGATYTNLRLQGSSSVVGKDGVEAAYVLNPNPASPAAGVVTDIKLFDKPVSTQGA